MFQKVRIRITMLSIALLLILYSISSLAVYTIVHKIVVRGIDNSLTITAHTAIRESQPNGITQINLNRGTFLMTNFGGDFMIMPSPLISTINRMLAQYPTGHYFADVQSGGQPYRVLFMVQKPVHHSPLFLVIAQNDHAEISVLNRLKSVILLVGIFGFIAATLAGFLLADRVLRPIRAAWQRQLEFVADASHELRTPLAVIQSNLDIAIGHTDESIVDNLEWLNNAHSESRRLAKLVQDLLTLARSDSENMPVHLNSIDISPLITHLHDLYESLMAMNEITFKVDCPDSVIVKGDYDRLQQLFVILLDNARKFTPVGGTISILLKQQKNIALIEVKDTGRGIAKEDLPRVFERFFTGDLSRERSEQGGAGLGLSIAKWIVEAHHGKISLESPGIHQGTTIHIELPTP